jgi:hypothetical protein
MDTMNFLSKYIFTLTTSSILGMATLFASEINPEETDSSTQHCSGLADDEATARAQNSTQPTDDELKNYFSVVFAALFDKERFNTLFGSEFVDSFIKTLDPNETIAQQRWDMLANTEISFDDREKCDVLKKFKERIASYAGPKELMHILIEDKIIRLYNDVFDAR